MTHRSKLKLSDVAKAAGVSLGTASNVFSQPQKVRPEVRARVERVAMELGYGGPDPAARLMRSGKVNAIAIVAPARFGVADTLRNSSFRMFMDGVAEVCDLQGANLVIVPDPAGSAAIDSAVVDGFIFGQTEHLAVIESAKLRKLPFAVVDFDAGPGISSVRIDGRLGGYLAAKHLLELGHRRFAIMAFLRDFGEAQYYPPARNRDPAIAGMPIDQEKMLGYRDALAEFGISVDDVPVVQAHPWDRAAAGLLLDCAPGATAVLSMSAMQGISVMAEARNRGISVPDRLSVVGFNDIPEAATAEPPLSVIDARNAEKGRIAAEMVFGLRRPGREVLSPELLLRSSTAPAVDAPSAVGKLHRS